MLYIDEVKEDKSKFGEDCITVLHLHDKNRVKFIVNVTLTDDDKIENTHYLAGDVYKIDVYDTEGNPSIEIDDTPTYNFYSKYGEIQGSFYQGQEILGNYEDGSRDVGDMLSLLADLTLTIEDEVQRLDELIVRLIEYRDESFNINITTGIINREILVKNIISRINILKERICDNGFNHITIKNDIRLLEIYINAITHKRDINWTSKKTIIE